MVRRKKSNRSWWNVVGHCMAMLKDREGRIQLGLYVGLGLIVFASGGLIDRTWFTPIEISPEAARFGWNEALAKVEAPVIAAQMPKFAITDADGNVLSGEGQSAELWKFAKAANGGKHIATWKQESGDCVSMGATNAQAYRMAFQKVKDQRNEVLKIPFPPYTYGGSRVIIGHGQLGRSPGAVGAWAAQFSQSHGVYTVEQAALDGFVYSGRLADQWGQTGPPKKAIEFGRKFRIRTVSQVKSWQDVRDALVHGYPVTVASNVGFTGGSYDSDGKRWLRPRGNWGHQMCFIGAEDRAGRDKGAYCLNSWGADAHPQPLNDEPPGGFWVDSQTVQRMVGQGDSWAYSDFDGFPASDDAGADWTAFRREATTSEDAELVARAEQPEPKPVLKEVRQMIPLEILLPILLAGAVLFMLCLFFKYPQQVGTAGAILLAISMIGIADRAAEAGARRRAQRMQQFTASQCACPNGVCAAGQCATAQCVNGQCVNDGQKFCVGGFCYPSKAAYEASVAKKELRKQSPGIEVAAEKLPADIFNAFGDPFDVSHTQAWTAMAPAKALRSYADCWEHEREFVLVIGKETEAVKELERTDKPVAFEVAHKSIKPGAYRIFEQNGRLSIESLTQAKAVNVSSVAVRRQQ